MRSSNRVRHIVALRGARALTSSPSVFRSSSNSASECHSRRRSAFNGPAAPACSLLRRARCQARLSGRGHHGCMSLPPLNRQRVVAHRHVGFLRWNQGTHAIPPTLWFDACRSAACSDAALLVPCWRSTMPRPRPLTSSSARSSTTPACVRPPSSRRRRRAFLRSFTSARAVPAGNTRDSRRRPSVKPTRS